MSNFFFFFFFVLRMRSVFLLRCFEVRSTIQLSHWRQFSLSSRLQEFEKKAVLEEEEWQLKSDMSEWPNVSSLRIRDFVFGVFWFSVFLFPFCVGQYMYKTRTGLSAIRYDPNKRTIHECRTDLKQSYDSLKHTLRSEEKPGDRY